MNIKRFFLLLFSLTTLVGSVRAEGLKAGMLRNGMKIYIYEDESKPDVYGAVVCNVGSAQDPADLTGLAHYLEHVMFKGTQTIGALDWAKEEPIYKQIIAAYDELAATSDPIAKKSISDKINTLSNEAAKFTVSNEFNTLIESMGGTELNAGTGTDFTYYHNSFPPNRLEKWLELASERFVDPVFRGFQTELETVYEESNMYADNVEAQLGEFIDSKMYADHPYGRRILGSPEHLKNPQLSKLIEFYKSWYTPSNMAIILVGNIKAETAIPLINQSFSKLIKRPTPERVAYTDNSFKGRVEYSAKLFHYPLLVLGYKTNPATNDPDKYALEMCAQLLNNSSRTGLLDKYVLDGDLLMVRALLYSRKEQGRFVFQAVPTFDPGQRRWESSKSCERKILTEIEKLKKGEIEEWLFQSIKGSLFREHELSIESNKGKAYEILTGFTLDKNPAEIFDFSTQIEKITLEDIKRVANKYFTNDLLVLNIEQGTSKKKEKLEKPKYEALETVHGVQSPYAQWFLDQASPEATINYANMEDYKGAALNRHSKFFYTKNPTNNIFTLTLRYGIGTGKLPLLEIATMLMNNAGVMGQLSSQEFKKEMSKLFASCSYSVDNNYLTVRMEGFEDLLDEACMLLSRQILLPQLDEKQFNSLIGSAIESRRIEREDFESLAEALTQYIRYGDKSSFIDRPSLTEAQEKRISQYTVEFQKATEYAAEVHYVGTKPYDEVLDVVKKSLPLKSEDLPSTSPDVLPLKQYKENTVYLLNDKDAQQSNISFFIDGKPFAVIDIPSYTAFSYYFGGGFGSLVVEEIREKRSMAYTAYGIISTPLLEGKPTYFKGFVGTQSDKTIDALNVYLSLINEFPLKEERIKTLKAYLKESALTQKPLFRQASQYYSKMIRLGFNQDPAIEMVKQSESLNLDVLKKVHQEMLAGKPIVIGIVGDTRRFNVKELEKLGKVITVRPSMLFSKEQ